MEAVNFVANHRPAIAALLVVATVGISCGRTIETEAPKAARAPIILISVDTLRSDRLPVYGYEGVETPAIDGLRRDGMLFERAYTHVPLTLPAHVSLLTGLLPPTHGVRDNLGYTLDAAATPLLQQTLREAGYATGAGVSSFVLRRETGINSGFDFYEDAIDLNAKPGTSGIQSVQRAGGETLDAVVPWLRSVAKQPFFFFFHIFEPHTPYAPPAEFAARYESAYDGEVAAADAVMGRLLDEIRDLGIYDQSLIVLLSDHGEGLGDHGESEHGLFLYRSTLQVPLIIKLPHSERAGESIARPVQLIDVYPTLVAAAGLPVQAGVQGTSLLGENGPEHEDKPIYAETFFPRLHFGWSNLAALILGSHHFIEAPMPELYDISADPDELDNLIASQPALEAQLRNALNAFDRGFESPGSTDAETRRRLEALGYVGEATTAEGENLPDPKTRVEVLAQIRQAHRLYADGDLEAAVPAFRTIITRDPGIEDAWEYLALSQQGLGQPHEAAATYRAATKELPQSRRLSLRAATLFVQMGELDQAKYQAEYAIPYDPVAAHVLLAQIAFKRGELAAAETEARTALSIEGNRRPGAPLILAEVLIARGDPAQAAEILSRTLDAGTADESITTQLAMIYLRMGQPDRAGDVLEGLEGTEDPGLLLAFGKLAMVRRQWSEAREWIERADRTDPGDATITLNLGLVAMGEERLTDAAIHLEEAVTLNPVSFDGWNALGSVRARLGDTTGAINAWERAHVINPAIDDVIFNLGIANAQAGRLSKAATYLDDYVARAQPGPQRDHAAAMAERAREAGNR